MDIIYIPKGRARESPPACAANGGTDEEGLRHGRKLPVAGKRKTT